MSLYLKAHLKETLFKINTYLNLYTDDHSMQMLEQRMFLDR